MQLGSFKMILNPSSNSNHVLLGRFGKTRASIFCLLITEAEADGGGKIRFARLNTACLITLRRRQLNGRDTFH